MSDSHLPVLGDVSSTYETAQMTYSQPSEDVAIGQAAVDLALLRVTIRDAFQYKANAEKILTRLVVGRWWAGMMQDVERVRKYETVIAEHEAYLERCGISDIE